ncbi:MAG: PAS domain-containing protein [Algicola sp.]|nr:PAS domain-containing protein [Algicola sp.]
MSNNELDISPDQLIISKTNSSGKITYCNPNFIKLTGYSEKELIGQSHNIVRHPEMPCGIFYLMWQTLRQNKEFNGFIKNKTKTNDSYWAFTNITPVHSLAGQLMGYTCAKRQPNTAATMMFSMYYEQMLEQEGGQRNDAVGKASVTLLTELLSAMGDDYEASVFKLQFS